MSASPARRRTAAALATAAIAAALTTTAAVPAAAHDELLGSTPESGEHLAAAPDTVSLQFSDEVLTLGAVILVVDGDGRDAVVGETTADGDEVEAALDPDLPDGAYEVRWRVVSGDGHPITGVIPFTVGDATAAMPAPSTPAAEPSPEAGRADAATSEPPILRTMLLAAGGAVAALLVWWGVSLRRTSRRRDVPASRNDDDHEFQEGSS
jgi:methionine-rich copper-binding protein CopC